MAIDTTVNGAVRDLRRRPMQDLRISVTDRCNFRCPYCMPADVFPDQRPCLPHASILRFEEIERVARAAVSLGVRKLRITGGEPLLRHDLPILVYMLAALPGVEDTALTTNGALLKRHAAALREAGLHRVTVSLDSLDEAVFHRLTGGRGSVGDVLDGIAAARALRFKQIKVNCVVIRGVNEDSVVAIASRFRGTGVIVRFIEYMDVGTLNRWRRDAVVPASELLARIQDHFPLRPLPSAFEGEVAQRYAYEDGSGEIGIIASVTQPFCGGCSRLRMSAEGRLYTCLFATDGYDLRTLLRSEASDDDLREHMASVWRRRADNYSEFRATQTPVERVEMYRMGG